MKIKNINTGKIYDKEDVLLEPNKVWIKGEDGPFPANQFELIEG